MSPAILQFGTGRLLQALVDLMVGEALAQGEAIGGIAAVQTTGSPGARRRVAALNRGGFPVRIRGLAGGQVIDREVRVDSIVAAFNLPEDWDAVSDLAADGIRAIVCNTADRGYDLDPSDSPADQVPRSFPAKLLKLLHARWRHRAEPLSLFPCELITGNGTVLHGIVDRLAGDWGLEPAFRAWLAEGCVWADTLVDRIVAEGLDPVGAVAEPYALWAIRARPGLEPVCRHPALVVTPDLERYERLKLHILNLGHTWLAERWLLDHRPEDGTVREALVDLAPSLVALYEEEVLPVFAALGLGPEAAAYRETVMERFRNPFLHHRLADIAANHAAKKERRIAPLLRLAETLAPALAQPRLRAALASPAGHEAGS